MGDENALERSSLESKCNTVSPLTNDRGMSYFPVSLLKLVVMNFCTWGAYQYYWFYENWQLIKKHECSDISPFWRACFAVIYCFPLFGAIESRGKLLHLRPVVSSGVLAGGWVLLSVLSLLPDPYWLVTFMSVVFLVPVQDQINRINEQSAPGHDPNKRFTAWNIVAVIVGGSVFVLAVFVTMIART